MNIIFGSICCLTDSTRNLDKRCKAYKNQLNRLEELFSFLHSNYPSLDISYVRVEMGWNNDRKEMFESPIVSKSIVLDSPVTCGAGRNILLKELYDSRADWLICMDDDRIIPNNPGCFDFFGALGTDSFIQLAKIGTVILPWQGPKDLTYTKYYREDKWCLIPVRAKLAGAMQVCCLPNLVKWGKDPMWFNGIDDAGKGDPPEDARWVIDWVHAGYQEVEVLNCFHEQSLRGIQVGGSSIFDSQESRSELSQRATHEWIPRYLSELYPNHNRVMTLNNFLAAYNAKYAKFLDK